MSVILGKKLKMDQVWKGDTVIPVTVVHVLPNQVKLIRTKERDGYSAVQLANGKTKREFKGEFNWNLNDEVKADVLAEGDLVRVSGYRKGRGFQGVVKRHNFGGGPKTHGQKNRYRAPGSIGNTSPQRVVPGRRMAGRMGVERVTFRNLQVVEVDLENNRILLKGAVPGNRGGLLEIAKIGSKK